MSYTVVTGVFFIRYDDEPTKGPEPDGDTIKFKPNNRKLVDDLPQISDTPPKFNTRGTISVRLEAIDALETHFGKLHQELHGAKLARDKLLAYAGFENVVYSEDDPNKVESANHDSLPGFVLSNGIDGTGRIIGFVYNGSNERPGNDGSTVTIDTRLLNESINTKLLADGHVYPAFYGTLPTELRQQLASKSEAARVAKKGLWPRSTADFAGAVEITSLESLETLVLWPKLFRRLAVYLPASNKGLEGFVEWLRKDPVKRDDVLFRLDTNTRANFHDILTIKGDAIKLNVQFEQIIIGPNPMS